MILTKQEGSYRILGLVKYPSESRVKIFGDTWISELTNFNLSVHPTKPSHIES